MPAFIVLKVKIYMLICSELVNFDFMVVIDLFLSH